MAPNGFTEGVKDCPEGAENIVESKCEKSSSSSHFKPQFIWLNIISIVFIHITAVVSLFYLGPKAHFLTILWGGLVGFIGGFGVTAGAHRLWTHRSYKAKWPLRLLLVLCYSVAGQNTLFDWVRDHRVHHKYSETDADPHNSSRGFFFAHVGWLMQRKHPEVLKKGNQLDMSDVLEDPIVQFHQKYFVLLKIVLCFILPIMVPMYLWNESFIVSFFAIGVIRYVLSLNFTWLVNSAAHMWGNRPYDKRINPVENMTVAILSFGEGWHNYHHVFPWDYKAAELGDYKYNLTTMGLDLFHLIGWAYDMKQPSEDLVRSVISRYGDGTHPNCPSPHEVDENGKVVNCCEAE